MAVNRPNFHDIPTELGPTLELPFQIVIAEYQGKDKLVDPDVGSLTYIQTIIRQFRFAMLTELEVYHAPSYSCIDEPYVVRTRYCCVDEVPSRVDFMSHVGAVSHVFGGSAANIQSVVVPCDLSRFCPVIKSPYISTDRVRVACWFSSNDKATSAPSNATPQDPNKTDDAKAVSVASSVGDHYLGHAYIRGKVLVAYPAYS